MKTLGQLVRRNRFSEYTGLEKIECSDILNLYKDESGLIRAIQDFAVKNRKNTNDGYIFIHKFDTFEIELFYSYEDNVLTYTSNDGTFGTIEHSIKSKCIDIHSFGRMIVITDCENHSRYYTLFNNGSYGALKEFVHPVLNFKLSGTVHVPYDNLDQEDYLNQNSKWKKYDYIWWTAGRVNRFFDNDIYSHDVFGYFYRCWMCFVVDNTTPPTETQKWKFKSEYNAWLYEMYNKEKTRGRFYGFTLIRIGLRMKDGSINFVTPPKLVGTGITNDSSGVGFNEPTFHVRWHLTHDSQGSVYRYTTNYFGVGTVKIDLDFDPQTIDTQIFDSICIFMSKPLECYNVSLELGQDSGSGEYIYTLRFVNQLQKLRDKTYIDEAQYYLVKEIPIKDSSYSYVVDCDLTKLDTFERLEAGYSNMGIPVGDKQFVYNGRLYDGGIYIKPYNKHTTFNFKSETSGTDVTAYIELEYNNMMYVLSGDTIKMGSQLKPHILITYPNSRCKRLNVMKSDLTARYTYYDMNNHSFDNFSYFLFVDDILTSENYPRKEAALDYLTKSVSGTSYELPSQAVQFIGDSNLLSISEVNNPFSYKFDNIITVGSGKILGIGAQSAPTSQGQFGQYPIAVICTDGVYLLNISSDANFAISSIVNILNRKTSRISNIVNVGNSLFYADDYNVNVISGGSVVDFTKGILRLDVDEHDNKISERVKSFKRLSGVVSYQDRYLNSDNLNLNLAYSKALDGLILDDILIQFNGFISRLSNRLKNVYQCSGENLAFFDGDNVLYDLSKFNMDTGGYKPIAFISNSITNFSYLKFSNVTLHANTHLNVYNIFGIFGSDDDINYYPLNVVSSKMKDISTGGTHHSSRYHILVYFASAPANFVISSISFDLEGTFLK